ncbi:MAG: glycine cleavage system protein GcvH [Gammaproteobacteria bacterium]|nr:glycine cleavage system protein GcvH [Gammaproteobacteria bacterium]
MTAVPAELKYTRDHEWLREEGDGTVTVGITDHAQRQLGELVFVELPEAGSTLAAGQGCAVVESVKAASDVYAPLAGTVTAVNAALEQAPGLVNTSPYGEGWLFRFRPATPAAGLLDGAAYQQLLDAEG